MSGQREWSNRMCSANVEAGDAQQCSGSRRGRATELQPRSNRQSDEAGRRKCWRRSLCGREERGDDRRQGRLEQELWNCLPLCSIWTEEGLASVTFTCFPILSSVLCADSVNDRALVERSWERGSPVVLMQCFSLRYCCRETHGYAVPDSRASEDLGL